MSAPDRFLSLKPNTLMRCEACLCLRITQAWLRFGYRTWDSGVVPILVPITSPDTINSTRRFC
jgi:hypothetical protein